MLENKLKYIIHVFPKSDFQASVAQPEGLHPFYTSSQELVSFCDIAKYPSDSITMGTGGNACINYSTVPFSTSTDCFNFRCTKNNTKFLYYWIYSKLNVIDDLYFLGMGLRHLQKPLFCNQHIMLPSMNEQQHIVDYLDKKVGIIDKLIENIKQQIEDLQRVKQSIIREYIEQKLIGSTVRVQDVVDMKKGPFGSSLKKEIFVQESNEAFKVYEQQHAIECSSTIGEYYIDKGKYIELYAFAIKPGDIIISCAGTIGKLFILPDDTRAGIINQALMRVRVNKKKITNSFFAYIWDYIIVDDIIKYSNGSAIKNIPPFSVLNKIKFVLPSLTVQKQMVTNLDKKTEVFDKLSRIKQQKVSELKEYKKSLIYECVTGKKEVL